MTTGSIPKEANEIRREMQRKDYKLNSADDFVDYRVSYFCQESSELIKRAFIDFTNKLGRILEEDRIMYENRAVIPTEDRQV